MTLLRRWLALSPCCIVLRVSLSRGDVVRGTYTLRMSVNPSPPEDAHEAPMKLCG
jgi:hypothetical protein